MTDNRGRHSKNKPGRAVSPLPKSVGLTEQTNKLRKKWDKLSVKERESWGFNFDNYRKGYEE